jgi:hypothetical protein
MKASEAKQAAKTYYNKLVSDHAVEYEQIMAREHKEAERVWALRGETLVAQIEGWIRKASKDGKHVTFEPTDVSPHGDEVIYLEDADRPIHGMLMDYFRKNGFTVKEYQYKGMKITW